MFKGKKEAGIVESQFVFTKTKSPAFVVKPEQAASVHFSKSTPTIKCVSLYSQNEMSTAWNARGKIPSDCFNL